MVWNKLCLSMNHMLPGLSKNACGLYSKTGLIIPTVVIAKEHIYL